MIEPPEGWLQSSRTATDCPRFLLCIEIPDRREVV
jgi:hypothetical protein